MENKKEVKSTMIGHEQCHGHGGCSCGCGGMAMSVEDEIKALEVHRAHTKLQLDMIEKRIAGLKHVGK
ncbi:MAG: hypothetical protein GX651_00210 [Methanomicrobiales archaeon]|nr:hypothetical protein [Methanomicrobiales archaeon]